MSNSQVPMSSPPPSKRLRTLLSSSPLKSPPPDSNRRQDEILAHVEFLEESASESFGNDIGELIRSHYPHHEVCLLDDVLATFALHYPEHGHAILHALLSCVLDGTITYNKNTPPFGSFVSLFSPTSENLSEQWALACGEILRVLTHYNRPIHKSDSSHLGIGDSAASSSGTSDFQVEEAWFYQAQEKNAPTRLLTPWITDSLLATPLGVRSDYFRWCGGVMGKYAAGGELKPPTTVGAAGPGKHPQLMPSTPRWAVANGAGVILSICDDEVSRYETADLTGAAVPSLLLPPPATAMDEHLVAGLPPLEPYARLFHRYYAIATPGATQRLLLGLLEAPSSWAPDALDAAVQLVVLLRAAEDYNSLMQLPRNWLHIHFLRPIGMAMASQAETVAVAAAALLFRILSQPTLLFPPPGHAQGVHPGIRPFYGSLRQSRIRKQLEIAAAEATEEATASGIASLMRDYGSAVEWRICTLWELAYGLLPLSALTLDMPELVVATPLQPPSLSWNLFRPLLRVFDYLPDGSPSEACLLRIFVATVEEILRRTFPMEVHLEQRTSQGVLVGNGLRHPAITELRTMVHSLFTEACPSPHLAARLLSVAFTGCLSHDAVQKSGRNSESCTSSDLLTWEGNLQENIKLSSYGQFSMKERGAVSTFDSYIVAAVCALSCEVQLLSISAPMSGAPKEASVRSGAEHLHRVGTSRNLHRGVVSAVDHARRLLKLLEALLALSRNGIQDDMESGPGEIVAAAVVAAHVSELLGRSKPCRLALTAIMRCKWKPELSDKAATVLALIEGNGKVVAAGDHVACVSHSHEVSAGVAAEPERIDMSAMVSVHQARMVAQSAVTKTRDVIQALQVRHGCNRGPVGSELVQQKSVDTTLKVSVVKMLADLPKHASDVVSLCMDRHNGLNDNIGSLAKDVLEEQEHLYVGSQVIHSANADYWR